MNPNGITAALLTHSEELVGLAPEWRALWERCAEATPFQSPAWLIPWWKHFGEGPLRSLVFRRSGRLIGFAPLYIYPDPQTGARQVFLLGCGNTDYLDVLAEPGAEIEIVQLLLNSIEDIRDEWDCCDFQMLRSSSALGCIKELSPEGRFRISQLKQDDCPVVDLRAPEARESSLMRKYPGLLHELQKKTSFEMVAATPENFDAEFKSLVRLHQSRWADRGQKGVLGDERVVDFHRDAARGFLKDGELRLDFLRINGEIAGSIYGFSAKKRVYYYLCGFDAEYSKFSPGNVLIGAMMDRAIREGASEFDFLRGSEKYKYLWGAKDQPVYRCNIAPV